MTHSGTVKALHPTFGFIKLDNGEELFFLPTAVDRDFVPFKQLQPGYAVTCEIENHPRGLRAKDVRVTKSSATPS